MLHALIPANALYCPSFKRQSSHLGFPDTAAYVPGTHLTHVLAPLLGEDVPIGHDGQTETGLSEYVPS